MDEIKRTRNSAFLKLISIALEMWIKTKCIHIEKIKIEIKGSILKIISGKIEGIKLKASRINFQGLHINHINIISSPIKISLNTKIDKGIITPQEFNIKGELFLSEDDINKIFSSGSWQWLPVWFSENLLTSDQQYFFNITKNDLIIKTISDKEDDENSAEIIYLEAQRGTLLLKSVNTGKEKKLPMEPSIKIKSARVKENKICIDFESKVKV